MEAQNYFGARGAFDTQALSADWNTPIGAGFEGGANAPNIRPPRATGGWAQDGTFFLFGQIPGMLRDHAQLAMGFMGVAMETQRVDMRIGNIDISNLFAGEIGREAALPKKVLALDFSLCFGCWSIKETDVIKLESPTELGQRVGIFSEENGVIIDVDLQRASVGKEGSRQEIKVRKQELTAIDFGGKEEAAAIVEHIEHGKIQC